MLATLTPRILILPLFAGDNTHTLANPIQAVLNRFGATIVTA